jgi:hypothetical protein
LGSISTSPGIEFVGGYDEVVAQSVAFT